MKTLILSAALAALLATAASAAGGKHAQTDETQVLIQFEEDWSHAEIVKDVDGLGRILDDDFVATFETGPVMDRQTYINGVMASRTENEARSFSDRKVVIAGDTAVIVDTDNLYGTRNGEQVHIQARVTTTYVRRKGQWRALAEHLVVISPSS
jgi:ketosteroid isomerase-like protein